MPHGWSVEIERWRGRDRLEGTRVSWRSAAVAGNGVRVQGRSSEVAGGGRGWKGSRVLQAGLWRCLRIRPTTRGSVMTEMIFISAPQGQRKRFDFENLS